jgi:undecaprenyl-phosphate 4-deoxy-4-formamido-L-arabinose transferase
MTTHHLPPGLSVVVPVFNSEGTLPELVDRLEAVLATLAPACEIVLVNDASRDGSWDVIRALAAAHPAVHGINLMRNYGQHNAVLCGLRAARYAITITIDDDLQHPPEEIPKLLARLETGCDVVYGTPAQEQHGLLRDLASVLVKSVLQKAMGAETARRVSAFRALRTAVRAAFADYSSSFVSIDVLLTWATNRFDAVAVRHEPRRVGTSNYTVAKLVSHGINVVTGFSTLPLQLASVIGFLFTLFGLGILIYVIIGYFQHGSVPGFTFLASIVAIFAGVQLFALGIIGEYLARVFLRSMGRPNYVVRAETGEEDA